MDGARRASRPPPPAPQSDSTTSTTDMSRPPILLLEHGELYAPEPRGVQSVLVVNSKVLRIGPTDRRSLDALGVPYDVIDASDGYVVPGLIDPHQHLLGGSGE